MFTNVSLELVVDQEVFKYYFQYINGSYLIFRISDFSDIESIFERISSQSDEEMVTSKRVKNSKKSKQGKMEVVEETKEVLEAAMKVVMEKFSNELQSFKQEARLVLGELSETREAFNNSGAGLAEFSGSASGLMLSLGMELWISLIQMRLSSM